MPFFLKFKIHSDFETKILRDSRLRYFRPYDLILISIDWRSLVTENNEELEYLSLKTERDTTEDFTPENIRKISGSRFCYLFILFKYTVNLKKTSKFCFLGQL